MTTSDTILVQAETVSHRSEPEEYIDGKFVLFDDYDKWGHIERKDTPNIETAVLLRRKNLQDVYDAIDHDTIIVTQPSEYKHPKAELLVRIYDGRNE